MDCGDCESQPNAFGLFDVHRNLWEWTESLHKAGASDREAET